MDKYLKQQLYAWVYDKIKSNPKKFGGDFSNAYIMYEYLISFYANMTITELAPEQMSILSSVSRFKNKILKKYPQYDYRMKFLPKNKAKVDESKGNH